MTEDPLTGLDIQFVPAEGNPILGDIGPSTASRTALDVIGRTVVAWECGHSENLEFCNRPGTRRKGKSCDCENTTRAILAELKAAGYVIVPADWAEEASANDNA